MKGELRSRLLSTLKIVLWSLIGAIIIAYFFLSTFLSQYSPLPIEEAGGMFFGPLFCGIVLGIILKEFDMPALTASIIISTFFAILFIIIIFISPAFLGIDIFPVIISMDVPKFIALAAIFILPLSLIGIVIGKALGETVFLTEEEKKELKRLREETRKWHEQLAKK